MVELTPPLRPLPRALLFDLLPPPRDELVRRRVVVFVGLELEALGADVQSKKKHKIDGEVSRRNALHGIGIPLA